MGRNTHHTHPQVRSVSQAGEMGREIREVGREGGGKNRKKASCIMLNEETGVKFYL